MNIRGGGIYYGEIGVVVRVMERVAGPACRGCGQRLEHAANL
jgi:hypothetical protein